MAKAFPNDFPDITAETAQLLKYSRRLARLSAQASSRPELLGKLTAEIRALLKEQGSGPLYAGLDQLNNQGEEIAFDILLESLDAASSTLPVRFSAGTNGPATGSFTLGLIPVNLTFMAASSPFETLKLFVQEHFDPAKLFDILVESGICFPDTLFEFIPQILGHDDWPSTWEAQLERTRETFQREIQDRIEGEYLSDFTVFSQQQPTGYLYTVGLVIPFVCLQPDTKERPPLLEMLSASSLELPLPEEVLEAWQRVAAELETQFASTPGTLNAQVLSPGYQMPALESQQDLLNTLHLNESILVLRQESGPGSIISVFGEAFEKENGIEWRLVLRSGALRMRVTWQMLAPWEETEEAIFDILHEHGIFLDQVHLAPDLRTLDEVSVCPECGEPIFTDEQEGRLLCGHPLPGSRHLH